MNNPSEAVRDACATLKNCGYEQTAAEVQEAFTALAAEVEGLRAYKALSDRLHEATANDLRAAGCSFNLKRTPIVLNDRAEQAEAKLAACEAQVAAAREMAEEWNASARAEGYGGGSVKGREILEALDAAMQEKGRG